MPGCYDALSAAIVQKSGFSAGFISGYALSASLLGKPDFGLLTAIHKIKLGNLSKFLLEDAQIQFGLHHLLNSEGDPRGLKHLRKEELVHQLGHAEIDAFLLRCQSDPVIALGFFNWVRNEVGIKPSTRNYCTIVHILAWSRLFSQGMRLLGEVVGTDRQLFVDLIQAAEEHVTEKKEYLGEVLNGDRLVDAPYQLDFRVDKESEVLCQKTLSKEDVAKFKDAVLKDYYFQMYYDDLPIWGFIGRVEKDDKTDPGEFRYLLYKHIHFDISYNLDHVIEINVQTDPNLAIDISEEKEIETKFLYSVKWKETEIPFDRRMDKPKNGAAIDSLVRTRQPAIVVLAKKECLAHQFLTSTK
ncbi:Transmembrane 9 superfamily member 2 [Nymphaea thermarum]|nr:Transmembrane 9 superfamily member 2 [Nymphaea thermarum]